ncbi:serine O-acetyltransferase [Paenarthrobacter nicotinovorans]|uniref:serine O-acetyltransferase n=1 Tax=Paenarthrobacter nicotinovorans TaxID=29320 RepID=UPI003803FF39
MSLIFYRIGHFLHQRRVPVIPKAFTVVGQIVFGSYIPHSASIGSGCKVAYGGSGLVVHPRAVIGSNCVLSPGVVIGGRGGHYPVPVIGSHVQIFPGAKILGPVRISDGAIIGANAVVVHDMEPGEVAVAPKAVRLTRGDT